MNKLLVAIGLIVLTAASSAFAQQRPQYTQYTLNNYLINPAISGIEDYADLSGNQASVVGPGGSTGVLLCHASHAYK
ncbi:hypothetical protein GCM10028895_01360 [Pontibacter rugosus]